MPVLDKLFSHETGENNLRIIITRHGERADLALGPKWAYHMKNNGGYDPRISYLTPRNNFHEWESDPPLTANGEQQSLLVGRKLVRLGHKIDYCYSSPAYRSIQTANKILESQGRKAVPINIEPGLFECPTWYSGIPLSFIPAEILANDKNFNINPFYSPIFNHIDTTENEKSYYKRTDKVIDSIIKAHKKEGGTILISGHASSIETVTCGMLHRRPRPKYLIQESNKVDYCNFAILEREGNTGRWFVHAPLTYHNAYQQQPIANTIPLHKATSQYVLKLRHKRPGQIVKNPSFIHKPHKRSYRHSGFYFF